MAGTIGKLRSKLPKVESMHPLSERDRAKKDYGRLPARAEVRSTSIRADRLPGQKRKVFTLNRDTTEVEKIKVRTQIDMPPIKIVPFQGDQNQGWAFVPNM